uniref:ribosomal protein L5 n=1 Tax=Helicotheca tamesis TaxID=374047 RepID=UPI002027E0DD|nr:ribosomal protein L5 [Helicotheca tamesis]QYB23020.1 ribosomal protein L5 [Helicotheca tamesis]
MLFIKKYIENTVNYDLLNKFSYKSLDNRPQLKKIYLNFYCKNYSLNYLASSLIALELMSSQKSILTYLKNSNILIKLKKGLPVGCTVILRKKNMNLFLTEFLSYIFPKNIHNSNKIQLKNIKSFSFKLTNPLLFTELEKRYQFFKNLTDLRVTIVTNSKTRKELFILLTSIKIFHSNYNSIGRV